MKHALLGALAPREFLRRHWQKRPLFVRDALDDPQAAPSPRELIALACRDDVESRLVTRAAGRWQLRHGPFRPSDLRRLPARGWTLLVQGVDLHLAWARDLMRRFSFVPRARQDDVMVSLAAPGGGVGPHFDSYDVFLIQTLGARRWRFSRQQDLALDPRAPLRILRRFEPRREWLARPGDLVYLPPRYAHEGVAMSECTTCSIGFRAPSGSELAGAFLPWLEEEIELRGRYADADLSPARAPASLPGPMVDRIAQMLDAIRWTRQDVARFLGEHLTEPKVQVSYAPPQRPLGLRAFAARVRARGVALALKSRMLVHGRTVFINGEAHRADARSLPVLAALANAGRLEPRTLLYAGAAAVLHRWYRSGYLEVP